MHQPHKAAQLLAALSVLAVMLAGCAPSTPQAPRLRIINSGSTPVKNLTVLFPEEQIAFGDIAAGATTEYKSVPRGVYRYAAYRFEIDGQLVTQPVIDWVGEEPMPGNSFTYTIDVDASRPQLQIIQLLNVTQDD